jgi:hypothetical protein
MLAVLKKRKNMRRKRRKLVAVVIMVGIIWLGCKHLEMNVESDCVTKGGAYLKII